MSKYNWRKHKYRRRGPAIADGDFSISQNGDIRWTGNSDTTYTVPEFHQWLTNLERDIETHDDMLSSRLTDNIITLNEPYNIDDNTARWIRDGSIQQTDAVYTNVHVLGEPRPVNYTLTDIIVDTD